MAIRRRGMNGLGTTEGQNNLKGDDDILEGGMGGDELEGKN
jgi:hypothetical protein